MRENQPAERFTGIDLNRVLEAQKHLEAHCRSQGIVLTVEEKRAELQRLLAGGSPLKDKPATLFQRQSMGMGVDRLTEEHKHYATCQFMGTNLVNQSIFQKTDAGYMESRQAEVQFKQFEKMKDLHAALGKRGGSSELGRKWLAEITGEGDDPLAGSNIDWTNKRHTAVLELTKGSLELQRRDGAYGQLQPGVRNILNLVYEVICYNLERTETIESAVDKGATRRAYRAGEAACIQTTPFDKAAAKGASFTTLVNSHSILANKAWLAAVVSKKKKPATIQPNKKRTAQKTANQRDKKRNRQNGGGGGYKGKNFDPKFGSNNKGSEPRGRSTDTYCGICKRNGWPEKTWQGHTPEKCKNRSKGQYKPGAPRGGHDKKE